MKRLLIIALLLSGCASKYDYQYRQADTDHWEQRETVTHVTESHSEQPVFSEQMVQFFVIAAGTLAAFSMAMVAGSE